ncbi:hypothetical protein Poli38472_009476 [Pythium oligandrum]|uniref:RNA polymerase II-associated protein 1 n=1 Tax=Pythium oligandrum TaxID=41045 RepID=A0A8K1CFB4_PYTOL|nr:hypothetical protein Poli38472_009476 [Pythium oligandrum]|eukprot:TMW61983.1 hypothetical protein Poli38472_009476 [Pythium oligandrum]
MATRKGGRREPAMDLDVDDELAQLLKEQEAFMRQNKAPAAKIVRMDRTPPNAAEDDLPPLEDMDAVDDAGAKEEPVGPQIVGHVVERDVIELNMSNRNIMPRREAGGFPKVTRRTGQSLFGRRQRPQSDSQAKNATTPELSGMGRIVERAPQVQARNEPKSDVVSADEWKEIDETNNAKLSAMSEAEIREAQQELLRTLDPALVAKLRQRHQPKAKAESKPTPSAPPAPVRAIVQEKPKSPTSSVMDLSSIKTEDELYERSQQLPPEERAKHEWMQPVASADKEEDTKKKKRHPLVRQSQNEKNKVVASSERFDFSGDRVDEAKARLPAHSGLYHHGDEPDAAGYTVEELLQLSRSTVASQRTVALNTIAKILRKRLQQQEISHEQCAPHTLPAELPIALRMVLDDQNYTALSAAITALHAFLIPASGVDDAHLERSKGTIVPAPLIHLHLNVGTKRDELLNEVIYIDTSESTEDGSVISDQQLTSLDPVQGYLKMDIITRLGYIINSIQLPDNDSMDKVLDILIHFARHSPRAAKSIVENKQLMKTLLNKYVENEQVLTLQTDDRESFEQAIRLATKTLVLVRVLCQSDRTVAGSLMERGAIQTTKGFLAFKGEQAVLLESIQLESLRIWRVLLSYGLDFHCFSYLYPLLCGFDGVNLVKSTEKAVHQWSDRTLAALFSALEAFARLGSIHEAQHYFGQLGHFIVQAKDEVVARLVDKTAMIGDVVVPTALRFLTVATVLVSKFHLNQTVFHAAFESVRSFSRGLKDSSVSTEHEREFLAAVAHFGASIVRNDLLRDDEDNDEVLNQFFLSVKPLIREAIEKSTSTEPSNEQVAWSSDMLAFAAEMTIQADHHDDVFIRFLYSRALELVQNIVPGLQYLLHQLFTQLLFNPVLLQRVGMFPDAQDATTMGHVLIPIYQALVNSTKTQEEHSLRLFAGSLPREKASCHLVLPQDEHEYLGSNLPLPFYWMFCPLSRLEYSNPSDSKAIRSASVLGPSHAQTDEMKVIVSAACRFIYQLEVVIGAVRSNTADISLGDEDKLFHLLHVFFAGAEVLFDEHVDLALTKLLGKYAISVVRDSKNPRALFDGILRNLRRFEHLESTDGDAKPEAPTSFTSDEDTVMTFIEKLANEFTATSFGNVHFARAITLFLLHDFPLRIRKWVWKELLGSHMLHRLESFEASNARIVLATGARCTKEAKHSDEELIQSMKQAVAARRQQQSSISSDRGAFAYWIAVHHIVAYVFGGEDSDSFTFARQTLLKQLLTDATPLVWKHLLSYQATTFAMNVDVSSPEAQALTTKRVTRIQSIGDLTPEQLSRLKGLSKAE